PVVGRGSDVAVRRHTRDLFLVQSFHPRKLDVALTTGHKTEVERDAEVTEVDRACTGSYLWYDSVVREKFVVREVEFLTQELVGLEIQTGELRGLFGVRD